MTRFLPYLPALACPLLMLVCMAGMRRMSGHPARTEERPMAGTTERIAHLERELAALRAEQVSSASPDPVLVRSDADPPSPQRVS